MNNYNPNIYHRKSIRLKGYDYSQTGLYFITICCQDRICRFGSIEKGKFLLNEYGQIAHNEWLKTMDIRLNVELGEFIIMPNHIHGIIRILRTGELHSPIHKGVCKTPLQSPSQTVGSIIRGYKSSVTIQLGITGFTEILWQRNYYEHIIRNEKSFHNISNYIINNPAKWSDDKFYFK